MTFFKKIIKDNAGATAIEYGLICALISIAALTAMQSLGGQLSNTFSNTASALQGTRP